MSVWAYSNFSEQDSQRVLEEIYHKYKRLMFAAAGKYMENTVDREDIVQTALVRLVRIFLPQMPQRVISAGYIISTVRSVSIELLQRQGQETKHFISLEDSRIENVTAAVETMDNLMLLTEEAEQLRAIWPQLPEGDRFLLEGKYILGKAIRVFKAANAHREVVRGLFCPL